MLFRNNSQCELKNISINHESIYDLLTGSNGRCVRELLLSVFDNITKVRPRLDCGYCGSNYIDRRLASPVCPVARFRCSRGLIQTQALTAEQGRYVPRNLPQRYPSNWNVRFGQKTENSFCRYEKGNRSPIPDASLDVIFRAEAERQGVQRRTVPSEEIVSRCMYAS